MTSQPLGEIASIVRGISFPNDAKSLVPRDGDVACLRTTNVQREVEWDDLWFVPIEHVKRLEQFVQPGDILISTANSYELVGKVALVSAIPRQATLGAFISLIRPRPGIDPKFLYHQLAWGRMQSRIRETASTTTNISNVSSKKLAALELDVPSLDEQRRIVAELEKQFSRLDEAVRILKRAKANLKRYKAAVLKAAFEAAGKFEQPPSAPLHQVAEAIVDCPHSTPTWTPSGFICVRTSNFQPGHLDLRSPRYVSRETYNRRNARLAPREGDVLYSREGGILGVACVVPRNVDLCLGQRMLLVRPGSRVRPRYVMHWLNSPQTLMRVRALTGGSASPHLNLRDVRAFRLPVPTLVDQDRIVEDIDRRLTIAEAIESEIAASEQRGETLRQAHLNTLLVDK